MEVTIRPTSRGFCKPSQGAKYAAHTTKVFRTWFGKGLRHIRLENGRILTKYDWIDEFLEKFEVTEAETPLPDQVAKVTGAFRKKMTRGRKVGSI